MLRAVLAAALFLPALSRAAAVPFELPSKDGLATVRGEIDVPACAPVNAPAVLMIGGTGLFSRNAFFGNSGTPRDRIFKDLSDRLGARCLATVRFDYRGVGCDITENADIAKCLDQELRKTVTSETILDDIQTVYDHAATRPFLDTTKLYVLGHSEGTMNAARLVARKSISPAGLFFIGGVTESARGILRWQVVDRNVGYVMNLDTDHDDVVTNAEIDRGYATSMVRYFLPKESLLGESGQVSRAEVVSAFENFWKAAEKDAADHGPADVYARNGIIFSAYEWWQRWVTEDVPMLENLKDFEGPIRFHNGEIDSQTPGGRERDFLHSSTVRMKSVPEFILHPGVGHGFNDHPFMGPLKEAIANQFADELAAWARGNSALHSAQ